jgi:hypothetical protein
MITEEFNERTVAKMEVALERACQQFSGPGSHEARKRIAMKILERARDGERTLKGFTDAALTASSELNNGAASTRSQPGEVKPSAGHAV